MRESLAELKLRGAEAFKTIVADAGDFELSSAAAVYFAMLNVSSKTKLKIAKHYNANAFVGLSGLHLEEQVYLYREEYQHLAHLALLQGLLRESVSKENLIYTLQPLHNSWLQLYLNVRRDYLEREYERMFEEKKAEIIAKNKKKFEGNTRAEIRERHFRRNYAHLFGDNADAVWNQIFAHGAMLRKESWKLAHLQRMEFSNECKQFLEYDCSNITKAAKKQIEHRLKGAYKTKMEVRAAALNVEFNSLLAHAGIVFDYEAFEREVDEVYLDAFKAHCIKAAGATAEEVAICVAFGENKYAQLLELANAVEGGVKGSLLIKAAMERLRKAVMREQNRFYFPNSGLEKKGVQAVMEEQAPDDFMPRGVAGAKEGLFKLIEIYVKPDDVVACKTGVERYIEQCRLYYSKAMLKVKEARASWGKSSMTDHNKMREELLGLEAEYELEKAAWVSDEMQQDVVDFSAKIVSRLVGGKGELLMLPTGVVILVDDIQRTKGFSPFDSVFRESLTGEQWTCWCEAWAGFFNLDDARLRRFVYKGINEHIQSVLNAEKDALASNEIELLELCAKHHVELPLLLNENSGVIMSLTNRFSVDVVKEVMAVIGDYVDAFCVDSVAKVVSDALYVRGVKNYVSGVGTSYTSVFLKNGTRISLKLPVLSQIASVSPKEVWLPLVVFDLGFLIYGGLGAENKAIFKEIVENRLNISKNEFYVLCGRRVDSVVERKKLMLRLLFVSEFSNYVFGKASVKIKEFFDERVWG
jgi:hypothetical protein